MSKKWQWSDETTYWSAWRDEHGVQFKASANSNIEYHGFHIFDINFAEYVAQKLGIDIHGESPDDDFYRRWKEQNHG